MPSHHSAPLLKTCTRSALTPPPLPAIRSPELKQVSKTDPACLFTPEINFALGYTEFSLGTTLLFLNPIYLLMLNRRNSHAMGRKQARAATGVPLEDTWDRRTHLAISLFPPAVKA